jgi:hypothetical protein
MKCLGGGGGFGGGFFRWWLWRRFGGFDCGIWWKLVKYLNKTITPRKAVLNYN